MAVIKVGFRAFALRPISNDKDSTVLEDDVTRARLCQPSSRGPRMHLIHRCQQGFTTVALMGTLLVGGLLVAATFTAVQPDIAFTKKDEDTKQAYGAAEAGLNYYLNRLGPGQRVLQHAPTSSRPR